MKTIILYACTENYTCIVKYVYLNNKYNRKICVKDIHDKMFKSTDIWHSIAKLWITGVQTLVRPKNVTYDTSEELWIIVVWYDM